jgi:hypothetical protein
MNMLSLFHLFVVSLYGGDVQQSSGTRGLGQWFQGCNLLSGLLQHMPFRLIL